MPQDPRKQVYDEDGFPVYGDDGKPLLETPDSHTGRSFGADAAIGALKNPLKLAVSGAELLHKIPYVSEAVDKLYGTPGLSKRAFSEADDVLANRNAAQTTGDVAAMVGPGIISGAMRGAVGLVPRVAVALEDIAVPGMSGMTKRVLERGLGRVSPGNVSRLSASSTRGPGGQFLTSPSQPAANAMAKQVAKPHSWPSLHELRNAMYTGGVGGWMAGSPKVGAGIGVAQVVARQLMQPRPLSAIAQTLHTMSPAINAATGGAGTYAAQALMRLFGESSGTPPPSRP